MQYLTMICDIKNSKRLRNREEIQYKLIDTLKSANKKFMSFIASPFLITIGDEWQGLLQYPCDYLPVYNYFKENLQDVDFYCGIGVGDITIHNFELTVNQLDGPSFYKAREAVGLAKQQGYTIVYIQ